MRTKTLLIAGQKWRVEWRKRPMMDRKPVYGYCDPARQVIMVCSALAQDVQRITVLHELLHSIHSSGSDRHPREEDACVNTLAAGLHQILREPSNRWLLDYILEGNGETP